MSNASNLSTLANVLDDGTSGQVLTSQGSGVVAFADAGGTGVTVHNNQAAMLIDAASADEGSLHYENLNNKLYVKQSSGFFLLASITNTAPTVSGFTETTGSGSATTIADNGTFKLTSGSNTVITLTATDPDLETLVYSATVTSGTASNVISSPSLPISNQSGNTFTLTPVTSGAGATITIRFDVSDGSNVVNKTHSFSIVFIVVDSNHTTLLATAVGTSDNNDIIDSSTANSGNPYSITVNNDAYAGSFSPYRSGGYSTYFDGTGDRIHFVDSSLAEGEDDFTLECWFYLTANLQQNHTIFGHGATPGYQICAGNVNQIGFMKDGTNRLLQTGTLNLNQWYHIVYQRASTTLYGFLDGVSLGTSSNMSDNFTNTGIEVGVNRGGTEYFEGYIRDVRIVKGTTLYNTSETTFAPPTDGLVAVSGSGYSTTLLTCHKPYITDGGANSISPTIYGDVSTKPFSPYDYTSYLAADNGGSVFITGSSKLEVPSCSAFSNILTGDYTLECWHYNSTNDSGDALDFRNAGGGVALVLNSGALKVYYTGSAAVSSANSVVKPYMWNHLVFCRVSNVLKGYVNGKQVFTHNDTTNIGTSSAGTGYIGSNAGSSYLNGYFSDVRITNKGVYTGEFTPSTSPLEITQSAGTNIAAISSGECKLLVKGTDASIIDKSQSANLKLFGDTTGSTDLGANSDAYSGSGKYIKFDGNGDYMTIPQISLGSGNFTIEAWTYLESRATTYPAIFSNYNSFSAGSLGLFAGHGSSTTTNYQVAHNGSGFPAINAGTVSYDQWVHLALVRDNGTITLYKDGTSVGSFSSSADLNGVGSNFYIGVAGDSISTGYIDGYIQDFRISKGKNRYTLDSSGNFTPPSAPLEG